MFGKKSAWVAGGKSFFKQASSPRVLTSLSISGLGLLSIHQFTQNSESNSELLDMSLTKKVGKVHASPVELSRVCVGNAGDLRPGQMKEVQVGPDPKKDTVLIANVDGTIHCVGSKCSHFGAPMAQGMLFGERVFCPWHLASFSVITGYPDFGPVFKGLPVYKVEIEDGKIYVNVPKTSPSNFVDVGMVDLQKVKSCENKKFVIVGAGPAGLAAAETLRQSGFTGKITIVNKEGHLPYDRTLVTKALYNIKADSIKVRNAEFFKSNQIDIVNDEVVDIDIQKGSVSLKNAGQMNYDKVLITTGLRPKPHPELPFQKGGNVFYVRGADDASSIQEYIGSRADVKDIVVIGGGFIGVESAATTKMKYKESNVNLVTRSELHSKTLGTTVGGIWRKLSEKNGVKIHQNLGIKSVNKNSSGKVTSVTLSNGDQLPADMVIVGIGSEANTDFLQYKGVNMNKQGKVRANSFLRAAKDVYVAGDIAEFYSPISDTIMSCEHYTEAISQGSFAAWNMLGKFVPYETVPFFWTRAFNKSLAVLGDVNGDYDVIVKGKPEEFNFIAYYVNKSDAIVGAAGMGYNKELIAMNQAMRLGIPLLSSQVVDPGFSWESLYNRIKDSKQPCHCQRKSNNEL